MTEEGTVAPKGTNSSGGNVQGEDRAGCRDRARENALGQEGQTRPDDDRQHPDDRPERGWRPGTIGGP